MSETAKDADDMADRIEELEAENEMLHERLEEIEETIDEAAAMTKADDVNEDGTIPISRRGTLAGIAGVGALGLGATGSAAAEEDHDHLGQEWTGSPGDDVEGLHIRKHDQGPAFVAVAGINTDAGNDTGIQGRSWSTDGQALSGHAAADSGDTRGLVGRTDSPNGRAVHGRATASTSGGLAPGRPIGVQGTTEADDAVAVHGNATGGGEAVGVRGETSAPDGYGIHTPDDCWIEGVTDIDSELHVHDDLNIDNGGNLNVAGTKHFVHAVDTPAGEKTVRYTSVEAGKALTEVSDVAEMDDGRAEIDLPEHFGLVTSDEEPLSIQVTPYAKEEVKPQVVEQSTDRIVVEDFSETDYDYTFAYTVKGVREGYEDEEIVLDDE